MSAVTRGASAQNNSSLDLFAKGTDGALYYKQWNSTTGWSASTSLGGVLTSGPAAVSKGAGAITVFVRGSDGALWSRRLRMEAPHGAPGPLSAGRFLPHRTSGFLMECKSSRRLCRRHERRPVSKNRLARGTGIPRWVPDLEDDRNAFVDRIDRYGEKG